MTALILFHAVAGTAALLAGAGGLLTRKGSPAHAKAGTAFFASMLMLAGSGAAMAALIGERGTMVIGFITCYLVATSWATARNRQGTAGTFERIAFAAALACAGTQLAFAIMAASSPTGRLDSLPAAAHYPFAVVAGLGAAFDLSFILRRRLSGRQRIARHVWRMCTALLIGAFSFFLGQQDLFPQAWRGLPVWFVPPAAVAAAMLFWLIRVRFARSWRTGYPGSGRVGAASAGLPASGARLGLAAEPL